MHYIQDLLDLFLNIDKHLPNIIKEFGLYTHLIIFLVIFCETGLVVTPFLPGDSLLFAVGAVSAIGGINFLVILIVIITAAIGGNLVNYTIGRTIGEKLMNMKNNKVIKRDYFDRTQLFYVKYGGVAIILSRFIPIIRTFAPFVAGVGKMDFRKFFIYNGVGGISWVSLFMFSGYFFGNFKFVKEHFEFIAIAIVFISFIPIFITFLKTRLRKNIIAKE